MQKCAIILMLLAFSCKGTTDFLPLAENSYTGTVKTSSYTLIKAEKPRGLLILFPCFGCDSENTISEFKIADVSVESGFSVLAMDFNQKLFLNSEEKRELSDELLKVITEHNLLETSIFIGGFSSGGNISLLITDYLIKTNSQIQPQGVFVVDSPIDLLGLYHTSEKNIALNYKNSSVEEATFIKDLFDKELGKPTSGISNYENNSPYTSQTQNIDNLTGLKNLKIRIYIEPELKWWKDNVQNDYEDLNAFYIQKLYDQLKQSFGNADIELIKSVNRGYRANGQKHPHSWSIVDQTDLIKWMTKSIPNPLH